METKFVPRNIPDLFFSSVRRYGDREILKYKVGHHYHTLTYEKLSEEVLGLVSALGRLGFKAGDRAIIISENRPEWVISDLAMASLGIVNVPVHNVLSALQLVDILKEIKPKAIFFSDHDTEDKLLEIIEEIGKIEYLISYDRIESNQFLHLKYFKELIETENLSNLEKSKILSFARDIDPESIASIIYTSGTTGHLKGVQLTHNNFIQNILGLSGNIWSTPEDRFFSILPLSHVLERTAGYYVPIYFGSSIGYVLDLANVAGEIRERKPNIVIAVPRLFEKIHEKVIEKGEANFFSKIIFRSAIRYKPKNSADLMEKIYDKLVFSKIRDNFGGEIKFFVSGGAKLPEKLGIFFERVGMIILEGYGLTETSPVVAVNMLEKYKFGTVGLVLNNIEVKIGRGDEILVKGPSVMKGYLKDEDNKLAFTDDGWLKTGDLGDFENDFLTITGRKKDLIVLTTGKKIAPVPIEEALEMSPYIDQAFIFGEGRKHIGALIVPSFEKLTEKFGEDNKEKLLKNPGVMEFLADEAHEMTKHLASIDRVKKFTVIKIPFSVENGDLTPTFKLRRKIIHEKYAEEIEGIYT